MNLHPEDLDRFLAEWLGAGHGRIDGERIWLRFDGETAFRPYPRFTVDRERAESLRQKAEEAGIADLWEAQYLLVIEQDGKPPIRDASGRDLSPVTRLQALVAAIQIARKTHGVLDAIRARDST